MKKGTWLLTTLFESQDKSPFSPNKMLCSFVGCPTDATGYAVMPITATIGRAGGVILGAGGVKDETDATGRADSSFRMGRAVSS